MKKIFQALVLVFLLGHSTNVLAQKNTVSAGAEGSSKSGSISFSIGQIDYQNASNSSGTITQGVQQPFIIVEKQDDDTEGGIELSAEIYPNPAQSFVKLNILDEEIKLESLNYTMYDAIGKLLSKANIVEKETNIDIANLAQGSYYLRVTNNNKTLVTFKLIKN